MATGGWKRRWPGLYRAAHMAWMIGRDLCGRPAYAWHRLTGRPYFGAAVMAGQTSAARRRHMKDALNLAIDARAVGTSEPLRVLEIGSWAGQSAVLWADGLRERGVAGTVTCVDPWASYVRPEHRGTNTGLDLMERAARRDRIFRLFWHNVRACGHAGVVVPFRASSRVALPLLREQAFDLVFIDGSHAYSDVIWDLAAGARLVRDGGLIGGDDLELQFDEVDAAAARASRECDYTTDPRSGREFHPGVTLGVHETFGRRIPAWDGFWSLRRRGSAWEDITLPD